MLWSKKNLYSKMGQKSFNFLKAKSLTLKEPKQGQKAQVSSAAGHRTHRHLEGFSAI